MSDIRPHKQLTILDAMLLIAGIAVGLWLFHEEIEKESLLEFEGWVFVTIAVLGGLSLAGGPMLIADRMRHTRRWRSGALLWFSQSVGCWALAPAMALARLGYGADSAAGPCFVYTLPLMGAFLLVACLVGGRPTRDWRRARGWWPEWFGMWVLVGWSLIGVYVLFQIYNDVF